jgi:hypothetical protein
MRSTRRFSVNVLASSWPPYLRAALITEASESCAEDGHGYTTIARQATVRQAVTPKCREAEISLGHMDPLSVSRKRPHVGDESMPPLWFQKLVLV